MDIRTLGTTAPAVSTLGLGLMGMSDLGVTLTADDMAAIEAAVPPDAVAGTRYDVQQMAVLESEGT